MGAGLTIREVQAYITVFHESHQPPTEAAVRKWLHRGCITRLPNGRICQESLEEWLSKRSHEHARRRAKPSVFANV